MRDRSKELLQTIDRTWITESMVLWFLLIRGSARVAEANGDAARSQRVLAMSIEPLQGRGCYGHAVAVQLGPVDVAGTATHGLGDAAGIAAVHDAEAHGPRDAAGAEVVRAEPGNAAGVAALHPGQDDAAEAAPVHSGPSHAATAHRWTLEETKKVVRFKLNLHHRDLPARLVRKLQAMLDVQLLRWLEECDSAGVCNVVADQSTFLRDEDFGKTEDNSDSRVPTAPGESDVVDLEPTSPVESDDMQAVPSSSHMDNCGVRCREPVSASSDPGNDLARSRFSDSVDWNSLRSAESSEEGHGRKVAPSTDHDPLGVVAGSTEYDPLGICVAGSTDDDPLGLVAACSGLWPQRSRVQLLPGPLFFARVRNRTSRTPLRRRGRPASGPRLRGVSPTFSLDLSWPDICCEHNCRFQCTIAQPGCVPAVPHAYYSSQAVRPRDVAAETQAVRSRDVAAETKNAHGVVHARRGVPCEPRLPTHQRDTADENHSSTDRTRRTRLPAAPEHGGHRCCSTAGPASEHWSHRFRSRAELRRRHLGRGHGLGEFGRRGGCPFSIRIRHSLEVRRCLAKMTVLPSKG